MKQPTAVEAWMFYIAPVEYWEYERYNNYINFLTQTPNLGMFVPCKRFSCDSSCSQSDYYRGGKCDKNGCMDQPLYIPLEEPEGFENFDEAMKVEGNGFLVKWFKECQEYQQALDRVVYEGWEEDYGEVVPPHFGVEFLKVFALQDKPRELARLAGREFWPHDPEFTFLMAMIQKDNARVAQATLQVTTTASKEIVPQRGD